MRRVRIPTIITRCAEEGESIWLFVNRIFSISNSLSISLSIPYSIGRLPIGRGMRPRRSYKAPLSQKIAIHKRNVVIVSDEENTSEYSHSPSSQHSTLESNTDIPVDLKLKKQQKQNINNSSSEPDSSDSSEEDEEEVEEGAKRPKKPSTPALQMGAIRSSDIISIPTFEADGAVNMV